MMSPFFLLVLTAVSVQCSISNFGMFDRERDRFGYRGKVFSPGPQQQALGRNSLATIYTKDPIWGSYEEPVENSEEEIAPVDDYEYVENKECCPSVTELIHPSAGVSVTGRILEVYHSENTTQTFYQTSCRKNVANKPCRYIRTRFKRISRCTQEYSYTYAIVRGLQTEEPWRMDHIRVRSGCSCKVMKFHRGKSGEVRKKRK